VRADEVEHYRRRAGEERARARDANPAHARILHGLADALDGVADAYERLAGKIKTTE
jgi:hypothetical protein